MSATVSTKFAAVLALDIAGYSRLMELDEAGTFARVRAIMDGIVDPCVTASGGRIVKHTGDGALAEWSDTASAAEAALCIQTQNEAHESAVRPDRRARFRMGLHASEIILAGDDVFGEGVNLAARLEGIAGVGEVYTSATVRDRSAGACSFIDLGERRLKNIARPVRVFRAARPDDDSAGSGAMHDAPDMLVPGFGDRPAIAVMPFKEIGADPAQAYFAEGVTEGLITALARSHSFPVISRNSAFAFGNAHLDLRMAGQVLGVRYVLEGSLRRAGPRLRTVVSLIDVDTDSTLLSETFDRELGDVLAMQDEIVLAIVGTLEPELLRHERERVATTRRSNPNAYELVQLGVWHHYKYDRENNALAQSTLRQALAIEPANVQGRTMLALALVHAANVEWATDIEAARAEALTLARQVVADAPGDPAGWFALGTSFQNMARPAEAATHLQEAIRLNPSHAAAHANLGFVYSFLDRPDEALPLFELAMRLSPRDPRRFIWLPGLAASHFLAGRYRAALSSAHEALQLNPRHPVAVRYLVASLGALDRPAGSPAALNLLAQIDGSLEGTIQRLRRSYNESAVQKLVDGLRRAGFT